MRFQRVSPDFLPFSNNNSNSNGKKSNLRTTPTATATATTTTTCKEREREDFDSNSNYDGVKALRFRSPSKNIQENSNSNTINANSSPLSENQNQNQSQRLDSSPSHGGDVLLQWGQKKRARLSRTEIRSLTVTHHSSSPSSSIHKLQRRGSPFLDNKLPPSTHASTNRPSTLRTKETSGFIPNTNRNLEDRSAAAAAANASPSRDPPPGNTRAVSRSTVAKTSPSSPDNKTDKKVIPCSASRKDEKPNPNPNGSLTRLPDHNTHPDSAPIQLDQELATTSNNTLSVAMAGGGEKVDNIEVIEWPKICVALSRKEKEDDFLAMKGTKLPHRPKKRAKNIERALQYCFPGMWLSDLTKSRYEVREKKSVKKQKRGGLKGMESMDSDSE